MIKIDGPGTALVTDAGSFHFKGAIFRVDLKTGHQKTLFKGTNAENPGGGIALLGGHNVAVTDCCRPLSSSTVYGSVHRINLKTGDDNLLNGSDFHNPLGIAVAP